METRLMTSGTSHDWDVFKQCDVRGRYGDQLTPAFALDLGKAIGTKLDGGDVVVAGDARPSTPLLKGALIEGLISTGCQVLDLGLVPTPAAYFGNERLFGDGLVMVTASHNPPGYNGFKLMLGNWPITPDELVDLRNSIETQTFRQGQGFWDRADILDAYQAHIEGFFSQGHQLRVVLDAGNGCLSRIAPETLRRMGYQVLERNCEIDGRFLHRDPNPAVAANLKGLVDQVLQDQADVGIAYDGDGDRVVFVDDLGRVLPGDRSLVLFIRDLLDRVGKEGDKTVVYDIKCSSIVTEEIERYHGTPVMERSGHTFIKTTLLKQEAVLGGEISGHFFYGQLRRDDALYATLHLLEILARAGSSLSEMMQDIPQYPITPDLRLPCPPEKQQAILSAIQEAFTDREISTIDGVRINFGDGWALARSSVTEPLLTLRFEGHTQARLEDIQAQVVDRVPALARLVEAAADQ